MKKHIAGFALFCFIIGAAAFVGGVAGFFLPREKVTKCDFKNYPKSKPVVKETGTTTGSIDKNSPRVRQAVFNLTTRQVNLELLFKEEAVFDKSEQIQIKYNYFRNSGQGVSFVHSEIVRLVPESFSYEDGLRSASVVGSYEWLDNLDSYDNLYVTAEITDDYASNKKIPKFDAGFAKEILLSYGKSANGEFYAR